MYGVIYTITNRANGKQYVGQTTTTAEKRWAEHIKAANGNKKKECRALHNAIRKYGPGAFRVKAVIVCDSKEELDRMEIMAIKAGGTLRPGGYNLQTGGSNGRPSSETRTKMSEALRGRTLSAEWRAKLSAALKGKKRGPFSLSHSAKMSEANRRRFARLEERAKISKAMKGIPKSSGVPARPHVI